MQSLKADEHLWEQSRLQNQQTQPTRIYLRVQFGTQATLLEIEWFNYCANPALQYIHYM